MIMLQMLKVLPESQRQIAELRPKLQTFVSCDREETAAPI